MSDNPARFGPREAQPLDALVARANAAGWDFFAGHLGGPDTGLEARRSFTTELEDEAIRRAHDAATIFDSAPGRRVLEWLCDVTVRRPVFILGLGEGALTYAALREGQNAVLFTLLKLIAEGRKEDPPQRPGGLDVS